MLFQGLDSIPREGWFLKVGKFIGYFLVIGLYAQVQPLSIDADDGAFDEIGQDLSYRFTQNSAPAAERPARSCDTGLHEFVVIEDFCLALQDEALNRGCAKAEREAKFKEVNCKALPIFELQGKSPFSGASHKKKHRH